MGGNLDLNVIRKIPAPAMMKIPEFRKTTVEYTVIESVCFGS